MVEVQQLQRDTRGHDVPMPGAERERQPMRPGPHAVRPRPHRHHRRPVRRRLLSDHHHDDRQPDYNHDDRHPVQQVQMGMGPHDGRLGASLGSVQPVPVRLPGQRRRQ